MLSSPGAMFSLGDFGRSYANMREAGQAAGRKEFNSVYARTEIKISLPVLLLERSLLTLLYIDNLE